MFSLGKKLGISITGDRVLIYATLFLVCSLISFFGAAHLAALAFLPAALAVELLSRMGDGTGSQGPLVP